MYKKFPGTLLNHFESKRCIKKRFFERIINFEIIKKSKSKEKKAQNNNPPLGFFVEKQIILGGLLFCYLRYSKKNKNGLNCSKFHYGAVRKSD